MAVSDLPTVAGVGTVASGTNAQTPPFSTSAAPVAGDIIITLFECAAADTLPNPPTGWAHVLGSPRSNSASKFGCYWKRFVAGDTAPQYTDAGNHNCGRTITISGCAQYGEPWDVAGCASGDETGGTPDTSASLAGGTTTRNNCLILFMCSTGFDPASDNTAQFSGWANANLGSITEQMDNATSSGTGGGFGLMSGTLATKGAVGTCTTTLANASDKSMIILAMKPAVVTPQMMNS